MHALHPKPACTSNSQRWPEPRTDRSHIPCPCTVFGALGLRASGLALRSSRPSGSRDFGLRAFGLRDFGLRAFGSRGLGLRAG